MREVENETDFVTFVLSYFALLVIHLTYSY